MEEKGKGWGKAEHITSLNINWINYAKFRTPFSCKLLRKRLMLAKLKNVFDCFYLHSLQKIHFFFFFFTKQMQIVGTQIICIFRIWSTIFTMHLRNYAVPIQDEEHNRSYTQLIQNVLFAMDVIIVQYKAREMAWEWINVLLRTD